MANNDVFTSRGATSFVGYGVLAGYKGLALLLGCNTALAFVPLTSF